MATIQIGILGMGRLGASVGLALKRAQTANPRQTFTRVGFDSFSAQATRAQKMGAVDSTVGSVAEAASNREIIVLALPYADAQEGYRQIAQAAKPGAVILDLSPLTMPSYGWAKQVLPAEVYLVATKLVLNPAFLFDGLDDLEHATDSLFDKGVALIMPTANAAPAAVELATDFAAILGATARFVDPLEHDVWMAAVESLPALLGLASFLSLHSGGGWSDAQRAGNPNFGRLTHHLTDTHPDDLRDLLLNSREPLVRQIDALTDVLGALRAALASNDRAAIEEALVSSRDDYASWLSQRQSNDWGDKPSSGVSAAGASDAWMDSLLGGYLAGRLRGNRPD